MFPLTEEERLRSAPRGRGTGPERRLQSRPGLRAPTALTWHCPSPGPRARLAHTQEQAPLRGVTYTRARARTHTHTHTTQWALCVSQTLGASDPGLGSGRQRCQAQPCTRSRPEGLQEGKSRHLTASTAGNRAPAPRRTDALPDCRRPLRSLSAPGSLGPRPAASTPGLRGAGQLRQRPQTRGGPGPGRQAGLSSPPVYTPGPEAAFPQNSQSPERLPCRGGIDGPRTRGHGYDTWSLELGSLERLSGPQCDHATEGNPSSDGASPGRLPFPLRVSTLTSASVPVLQVFLESAPQRRSDVGTSLTLSPELPQGFLPPAHRTLAHTPRTLRGALETPHADLLCE